MIRVAITDDHLIVIDGIKNVLQGHKDIIITDTYLNGEDLLKGLIYNPTDVLLLDLQLPDKKGNELIPILLKQYPLLNIIILSGMESTPYIKEMMQKGCKGYLLKSSTDHHMLVDAITTVYTGDIYLDKNLKEQLLREMLITRRPAHKIGLKITQREKEILKLIIAGYTNHQIADQLVISLRTVETHRYNLLQKLDVKNTVGLIHIVQQMGLLE